MKFTEKYEIVEMVTSGRVCTFLGRDRATQEEAVIWTFECPGKAVDLSTATILARFCSLAPNPPGILVKAGLDEQSSTAFIATKTPAADLDTWVLAYQSYSRPRSDVPQSNVPQTNVPQSNAPPATTFTETFRSIPSAPVTSVPLSSTPPSPKPSPSSPVSSNQGSSNPVSSNPASTTGIFQREADSGKAGAGEFTSFFRNPFDQPAPSSPPMSVPDPRSSPPSRQSAGEFTSVFGRSDEKRETPPARPVPEPPPRAATGSFTQLFTPSASPLGTNNVAAKPPAAASPFSEPASPPPAPGSFTQIFGGGGAAPGPIAGDRSPTGGSIFSEPDSSERPPQAPGSFTQIFGGGGAAPGPTPGDRSPTGGSIFSEPASSERSSPPQAPGAFTQIFGGGGAAPGPIAEDRSPTGGSIFSEPVSSPQAAGSFTQVFGGMAAPGPTPSDRSPTAPSIFSEPVASPPRSPVVAASVHAPPLQLDPFAPRTPPLVAQPIVVPPVVMPPIVAPSIASPFSATSPEPAVAGASPVEDQPRRPSEFTMFMDRSQLRAMMGDPAGAVAPPPPAPPPPAAKASAPVVAAPKPAAPKPAAPKAAGGVTPLLPLIAGLVILLAIGAILVMYFVMKH